MASITNQVRMLFDLNKCIGCHTCTMACKTMWTDRNEGQMYMYWNNVETHPGKGYPKNWQEEGAQSGWDACGDSARVRWSPLKGIVSDHGAPWAYNYAEVLKTEGGIPSASIVVPSPDPSGKDAYASNWDEDVGEGEMPNNYYFYLPRICNHCTKPACVASCPRQSVYKRAEDGIVLIDQNRCRGYRFCIQGCPYKKIYFNPVTKKSEKCIFCYPRIEQGEANFCVAQCVGRIRWVAYANDSAANLNKLVHGQWTRTGKGVALRLHPEFGTEPNTFYIPPLSPPGYYGGQLGTQRRIPTEVLARMFGDDCSQSQAEREDRVEEILEALDAARDDPTSDLARILIATSDDEQVQLRPDAT